MIKRFFFIAHLFYSLIGYATPFSFSTIQSNYVDDELVCMWSSLDDLFQPTINDYLKIEHYLKYGKRSYLDALLEPLIAAEVLNKETIDRSTVLPTRLLQSIELVGPEKKKPVFERRALGGASLEEKERCIILYASHNKTHQPSTLERYFSETHSYGDSLLEIVDELEAIGYRGHVQYRIGGFPLTEKGGLRLAHVPYSFKVLSFIEASLEYDTVLWFDVSMHPTKDLVDVFSLIEKDGLLCICNEFHLDYDYNFSIPILPDFAINYAGLKVEELVAIPHVIGGILGVSFKNSKGHDFIAEWYRLTALTYPAMTLYPDEFLISVACWKTGNKPNGYYWDYFDIRSQIPNKPSKAEAKKPFWFDKS